MTVLPEEAHQWITAMNKDLTFNLAKISADLDKQPSSDPSDSEISNGPIRIEPWQMNESYLNCAQSEEAKIFASVRPLREFVANTIGTDSSLFLSKKQFEGLAGAVDLVTADSTRTNCFTKK